MFKSKVIFKTNKPNLKNIYGLTFCETYLSREGFRLKFMEPIL